MVGLLEAHREAQYGVGWEISGRPSLRGITTDVSDLISKRVGAVVMPSIGV